MKTFILSILLLSSTLVFSQWTSLQGPGGGTTQLPSFAIRDNGANPDDIFVFCGDNIYMSSNEGVSWTEAQANGLPTATQATLAVSGTYLYAAIPGYTNVDAGVFVSTDNGNNWTMVNNGLPVNYGIIKTLAVQGTNVFAGSAYNQGVYISSNNGQSWTAVNVGLSNKYIYCFHVDGTNLYAGTGNGIFVTSNNGQSWTSISTGLPTNEKILSITSNNSGLFAAVENTSTYNKVYFSGDNGSNWTMVNTGFPSLINDGVSVLTSDGVNVYGGCDGSGVYTTTDNGQHWVATNYGLIDDHATLINALAFNNGKIYAATNQKGIYVSSDFAQSWQKRNTGLAASQASYISMIGDSLIVGTGGGLGIFFYNKTNQTWSTGTSYDEIYATNTNAIGVNGNSIFVGETNGLFVSHDRGNTWSQDSTIGNTVKAVVVENGTIYLGCDNTLNQGVLKSVDNGATWTQINTGMTSNRVSCLTVQGNEMYAGTSGFGVFKSVDGGQNWIDVSNGITDPYIKCISLNNGHVYVGTGGSPTGGLFISSDGGQNWSSVATSSGITNLNVMKFTHSGIIVFAAVGAGTVADAGVYASNDYGITWNYLDIGRHKGVVSLFADNTFLYAGTIWGGVIKAPLNTVGLSEHIPSILTLQLYPNPARDFVTLSVQNKLNGNFYEVYDLTGRVVIKGYTIGKQTVLDIKDLKRGLYFVRLHTESCIQTQKFIKF